MSVPTLLQLIEEKDAKTVVAKIIIGGTELPVWTNCSYQFDIGQVPTATITVPGLGNLPAAVQEEAAVQIWFGYKVGVTALTKLVFGGAIVDSVGNNGSDIIITCVMDGPRKLSYSYNRRIAFDFNNVTAVESVTALLELAGVANYSVNLDAWLIGTAVPYTAALGNQIQFSSYGDAINKVAEVDGSPWYAMPTGQVRVEKRDPVPSPTARRVYFTSILTGPIETSPVGIANTAARPRINDISKNKNRRDVANFIEVDGAVLVTLGPNGEQNSNQIKETVDGLSGQFPNGAYWIPTPPLFQDFNFANELIDTNAKAFEVCERYFDLKNRLFEDLPITIPGDPDVFLGETVAVKDPIYSGTESLYFVKGYSTTIDQNSCTTSLQLTGGPEAGTTGFASPFAEFTWTYDPLIIPGGSLNGINLGPGAMPAAKLCEDKPANSTPNENTNTAQQATNSAMVYIGLDGTSSQDFDGQIVSWVWTWYDSSFVLHTLNGPRHTIVMAPAGSLNMTLTVTDNSGRTDAITKNINTSVSLSNPPSFDPNMNDTEEGGGVAAGPCTEEPAFPNPYGDDTSPGDCQGLELGYLVAAKTVAMGSNDNRIWRDLTKAAAGVTGDFISVDAAVNNQAQTSSAIFGTSLGEIVKSIDNCATGTLVFTVPGNPRIECIHFDTVEIGSGTGELPTGDIPVYTQANPGTMTIVEAYQQCRVVGFSHDTAIVAVAIMVRESGLYSKAMNTAGNTPPSTDRGIAQWNDFYHPDISDACAYNTECAITKMFQKSSGGSDFSPWRVAGGTHLTLTDLSAVQAAVGSLSDTSITTQDPTISISPSGLKVWVGTSDGRIYVSLDSGDTWELWVDFMDNLPINQIGTPPRYGAQVSSLWVFGGDTGNIDSLVRIDPATDKNFVSLFIDGDLRTAIQAVGAGDTCRSSMNETASILVFSGGGMTERVWTSQDPLGDPTSWIPCGVGAGTYNTVAPGYGGEFVVAGSTVMKTSDNANFTGLGSGPSTINHMLWRGLPGMYVLALNGGLYTTIDFGDTLGAMRPNAGFSTTWPAGAIGYQVAVSYGARTCPIPTPGDCDKAPRYEAAVGVQAVSANYLTNGQQFGDSIIGASVDVPNTSLITTFYEGSAHHFSLGHKGGSGTSLVITITPTIINSFIFLAVASRTGAAPTSVTDSQSLTWTLIQSVLSSDSVGPIRLSIYRTNANAASILGLTVTVAFGTSQSIILAIADEWIGLSAAVGTSPIADSDVQYNPKSSPINYPDDYLLSYTFTNPYAFEEAIPAPISFGIALQLEPCTGSHLTVIFGDGVVSSPYHFYIAQWNGSSWKTIKDAVGTTMFPGLDTAGLNFAAAAGAHSHVYALGSTWWAYLGDSTRQTYRSVDKGQTWTLDGLSFGVLPFPQSMPIGGPIAKSADDTLYAAVADVFPTPDRVYKSSDNGNTWVAAGSFPTTNGLTQDDTYSIVCHPTDPNTIVAYGNQVSFGPATFSPAIYVSTDAGVSFTQHVLFATSFDSIGVENETMMALFTSTGRFIALASLSDYSTNLNYTLKAIYSDNLSTFSNVDIITLIGGNAGCDPIVGGLCGNSSALFCVISDCAGVGGMLNGNRVFLSTNNGASWSEIATPIPSGVQGIAGITYDDNQDILYAIQYGVGSSPSIQRMLNASSGAGSWANISSGIFAGSFWAICSQGIWLV